MAIASNTSVHPGLSMGKLKAGTFDGPQISKLIMDYNLTKMFEWC